MALVVRDFAKVANHWTAYPQIAPRTRHFRLDSHDSLPELARILAVVFTVGLLCKVALVFWQTFVTSSLGPNARKTRLLP